MPHIFDANVMPISKNAIFEIGFPAIQVVDLYG